jgi:hypothetical protein
MMRIRGKAVGMACILAAVLLAGWSWWKIANWSEHHRRPAQLVSNPLWADLSRTARAAETMSPPDADKAIAGSVVQYIAPGTAFEEAERVLLAAGFRRGDHVLIPARRNDYSYYVILDVGPSALIDWATHITVKLYPRTAGQFDTVARVEATIYYPSL